MLPHYPTISYLVQQHRPLIHINILFQVFQLRENRVFMKKWKKKICDFKVSNTLLFFSLSCKFIYLKYVEYYKKIRDVARGWRRRFEIWFFDLKFYINLDVCKHSFEFHIKNLSLLRHAEIIDQPSYLKNVSNNYFL